MSLIPVIKQGKCFLVLLPLMNSHGVPTGMCLPVRFPGGKMSQTPGRCRAKKSKNQPYPGGLSPLNLGAKPNQGDFHGPSSVVGWAWRKNIQAGQSLAVPEHDLNGKMSHMGMAPASCWWGIGRN